MLGVHVSTPAGLTMRAFPRSDKEPRLYVFPLIDWRLMINIKV